METCSVSSIGYETWRTDLTLMLVVLAPRSICHDFPPISFMITRESGDPSKAKDCLPDKSKQFLVTRNGESRFGPGSSFCFGHSKCICPPKRAIVAERLSLRHLFMQLQLNVRQDMRIAQCPISCQKRRARWISRRSGSIGCALFLCCSLVGCSCLVLERRSMGLKVVLCRPTTRITHHTTHHTSCLIPHQTAPVVVLVARVVRTRQNDRT